MTFHSSSSSSEILDYLLRSATFYKKDGQYSFAKCYLMTAAALAPDDYLIKYETYQMCKTEGNIVDAARQFTYLFTPSALTMNVQHYQTANTNVAGGVPKQTKKQHEQRQRQFEQLKWLFIREMISILYSIGEKWCELIKYDQKLGQKLITILEKIEEQQHHSSVKGNHHLLFHHNQQQQVIPKSNLEIHFYKNLFHSFKKDQQIKYDFII